MQDLVTVFGGSGFIGTQIVRALARQGLRIRVAVRQPHLAHTMRLMGDVQDAAVLYRTARGIHTSGLSDGAQVLMVAQDVGRHNTIDRLWGQCLRRGQPTEDLILLSTGRISSEMLNKAAKMRIPFVASRTSPTALSIELARAWNITLVGYLRTGSLRVYTAAERLGFDGGNHGSQSSS